MKKHFFALALAALMAVGAMAQENRTKISVNAGPQWNSELGFKAGADVHIPLGNSRWGFEPGLYWSYRHATADHSGDGKKEEFDDKLHYLKLPLLFNVRAAGREDGAFKMSFLFGPYFAYGLDGTSHCAMMKDGELTKFKAGAFSDEGRLESRVDYGLEFGVDAVIRKHFKVGVFTEIGLKDIYRPNSFFEDLIGDLFGVTKVNIGAGVSLGYQF